MDVSSFGNTCVSVGLADSQGALLVYHFDLSNVLIRVPN